MADSVRIPPSAAHRFVPTLTEVVQPDAVVVSVAPVAPPAPPVTAEMLDQIVDTSIQRAEAALTQKLPELLAVLLHEHALAVSERLRREIKASVRESVTAAVAEAVRTGGLSGGVAGSSHPVPPRAAGDL